jgi:hypothetical protein
MLPEIIINVKNLFKIFIPNEYGAGSGASYNGMNFDQTLVVQYSLILLFIVAG